MMDKAILNINSFSAIFELSTEWTGILNGLLTVNWRISGSLGWACHINVEQQVKMAVFEML